MAVTPPPSITPAPLPAPQRGDRATFSGRVDAFITWLTMAVSQFSAVAANIAANALDAFNNASIASTKASAAAVSAATAAAGAASVAMSPNTNATSVTNSSINPADGSFFIVVEPGKSFFPGNSVKIALAADPTKWLFGDVTSYDSSSGQLRGTILRSQSVDFSNSFNTTFLVSLSGPAYTDGPIGGAISGPMTADLVLTAASGRLVAVAPSTAGLSIFLPDATTLLTGPDNQFVIHLTSAVGQVFDVAIRNASGALLGFAVAGGETQCNLVDNSSAAGAWTCRGIAQVGVTALGKLVASAAVGGTNGTFIRTVNAGGGLTLLFVHGTSLHAIAYNETSRTFSPPALLRASLSTAGADGNVLAVLTEFGVLVASIQDGTTALQTMLVVQQNDGSIGTSTPVSTTLAGTAARLLSLDAFTGSCVLAYMVGTTSIRAVPIAVGTSTVIVGTEAANTTVGACAVLPMADPGTNTSTFAVLTSSATAITAKGYSITGSTLTTGTAVTSAATAATFVKAKHQPALGTWLVSFLNTTMKMSCLTMAGTVPAFSAPLAASSIPTVSSFAYAPIGDPATSAGCIAITTGVDASGRFVADFTQVDGNGALVGATLRKAFAAAPTVAYFGQNTAAGNISIAAYSAKEAVLYTFNTAAFSLVGETRTGALSATATAPAIAEANYPRAPLARNTVANYASGQAAALGDGSKPIMIARGLLGTAPLMPIADMTLSAKGDDAAEAWIAFNQAPDTALTIQKVRIA